MKPDDLIRKIEKAFDNVPKPERVTLSVARGLDDYVPDEQLDELRKQDKETRWQDVSDKDLEEYWDVHPFLDAPAFRYYIPAFMIWCIRHYNTSDLLTGQWTLASLWLEPEKLELLTQDQRQVIVEFLKFSADNFDDFDAAEARKLYEIYWKEYDNALNQSVDLT